MITCLFFKGKIKNEKDLCGLLGMDSLNAGNLIAAGFSKFGYDFFEKLNGLFAFVLRDADTDTFICARDRFGGQALYYGFDRNGTPVFSDAIQKLLTKHGIPKKFREDLLEIYLSYSYMPGEETFFEGISKPLPGYYYVFKPHQVEKKRYFTPCYHIDDTKTLDEWAGRLSDCLDEIFAETTDCDASLLSGGIDSTYLAMRTAVKDTYTAAYQTETFSESDMAAETSAQIGADHHAIPVTPETYLSAVPLTLSALEQPAGDPSACVLYRLCEAVAADHPTCYSGEGVDELFMGYYYHDIFHLPAGSDPKSAGYIGCMQVFSHEEKGRYLKNYDKSNLMAYTDEVYRLTQHEDHLNQAALLDLLIWMNGNLLPNVGCIGDHTGLNFETPYLDNRLYDLTLQIPSIFKRPAEQTKLVFRKAIEKVLGQAAANRPKRGFPVPTRLWMRRPDYIETLKAAFTSETAERFFNTDVLLNEYDRLLQDETDTWTWRQLWCIYCFIIWYDLFF